MLMSSPFYAYVTTKTNTPSKYGVTNMANMAPYMHTNKQHSHLSLLLMYWIYSYHSTLQISQIQL